MRRVSFIILRMGCLASVLVRVAAGETERVVVSSNHRFLQQPGGTPFS